MSTASELPSLRLDATREPVIRRRFGSDAWRFRAHAEDLDVHPYRLGELSRERFEEVAATNTAKHYGDVLGGTQRFEVDGGVAELAAAIEASGIGGRVEVFPENVAGFWAPSVGYGTRSQPSRG